MLDVRPYAQKTSFSCGPAALKMVLEYYGFDVSEKMLRKLARTTKDGTVPWDIVGAAEEFGCEGSIKDNGTIRSLQAYVRKKVPVIVDWFLATDGHYSVVVDIDNRKVKLQDPSIGHIRTFTREEFKRVWFSFDSGFPSKEGLVRGRMIVIEPPEEY